MHHHNGVFIAGIRIVLCHVTTTLLVCANAAGDVTETTFPGSNRAAHGPYCGLYSLFGALAATGKEVDFESLLTAEYIGSKQGSSADELRQAAEDNGAICKVAIGLGSASLLGAQSPMVLHVASEGQLKEYDHWVLFLGMQDGKARIVDAPDPIELMPLADLLAIWDGVAVVVSSHRVAVDSIVTAEHQWIANYVLIVASVLVFIVLLNTARARRSKQQPVTRLVSVHAEVILLLCLAGAMGPCKKYCVS